MSEFIKNAFFAELTIFSSTNLLTITQLRCTSMTNQECKARPAFVNVNSDEHYFILLVLKKVNGVVVVTISMIHIQKCVFLMLSKT